MDADLIMLCLNHLNLCKNIYLYRETPHFIKSLNSDLDPKENYLIHINILANEIYKTITNNSNINNENFYHKIQDYIFICFFLGNDFMPHFPSLNIRLTGFTILLELYKELFNDSNYISYNKQINYKNLKLYIKKLAENEENFIKEVYNIREKKSKKFYPENNDEEIERKFIETPSWERNIEKFINPYEKEWEFRYYYSLFDVNIDNNKDFISKLSHNYVQTLLWTYNYYNSDCTNWTHTYNYNYPPLLIDLYKAIPYFESEITLEKNENIIHSQLLLAYVLPKSSLNLLQSNIKEYLLKNYNNYYKENYDFQYAFCKYFWEAHVIFPYLNFDNFAKTINNLIS
jgi:5'-3' exonuclease